jgi:ABC-type transport system involved in multi-copper enzyme maturation permease subunit
MRRALVQSGARIAAVSLKELRELGRQRMPFVIRTIYAAMIGATILGPALIGGRRELTGAEVAVVGNALFGTTVTVQSLVALLLGLALGVGSIQRERMKYTLGLLLLSRARRSEIVAGKLASIVGLCSMVFFSIMPLLVILGWGGGVDYRWMWRLAPLTAVMVLLGAATGMLAATLSRSRLSGALIALLMTVLLLLIPLGLKSIAPTIAEWLGEVWLWVPAVAVVTQGKLGSLWWPLALVTGVSLVLAAAAVLLLRRAVAAGAGGGMRRSFETVDRLFERVNPGGLRLGRAQRLRMPRGSPIAWLARISGGLDRPHYRVRLVLLAAGASLLLLSWSIQRRFDFSLWVLAVAAVSLAIPLMTGANAIAGERSRHSLDVLLATPLSGRSVLRGKGQVGLELLLLALLPSLGWLVMIRVLFPQWFEWGDAVGLFVILAAQAFCAFSLALGLSLFLDTPLRAGISGGLLLLVVNFSPWMSHALALSFGAGSSLWPAAGLATLIAVTIGSGVLLMMQREVRPRWAFMARLLFLVCLGGLFEFFFDLDSGWPLWPLPIPDNTAYIRSLTYLGAIGSASYGLVRDRFDEALERSA